MSLFGKSFEREIGKNTGKLVSNILFGDGHSTPYRRVQEQAKVDLLEAKVERENKAQLFAIDSEVLKNVDKIATLRFSKNVEELIDQILELEIHLKANRWHNVSIGNTDEAKIRNKFSDSLFEKFKQGVRTLKNIEPNHLDLDSFEKTVKKSITRKFIRKYPLYIGIALFLFFAACLTMKNPGIALMILFSSLILIFILSSLYSKSKRTNREKARSQQNNQSIVENIKVTEQQVQEVSVFIDLNINNRIENRLAYLWNKYKTLQENQIINRKPIFSADGVINSVLFVGINPSFNPADDNSLIKSNDDNSLMYGSFYQRPDAPEFFKKLEFCSSKLNKGYTHINLLYAREDDRNLLLKCDQNFIREQLELTYETIAKIKPVAIVFFSDFCKDLIFGEDRWVNPNSESNGGYILNGTNFPVFFSDDLTSLSELEQLELINKIEKSI